MSVAGSGGGADGPRPGLPDEIVLFQADDRLWEQQLELRKEVSPLS